MALGARIHDGFLTVTRRTMIVVLFPFHALLLMVVIASIGVVVAFTEAWGCAVDEWIG